MVCLQWLSFMSPIKALKIFRDFIVLFLLLCGRNLRKFTKKLEKGKNFMKKILWRTVLICPLSFRNNGRVKITKKKKKKKKKKEKHESFLWWSFFKAFKVSRLFPWVRNINLLTILTWKNYCLTEKSD